MLVKEISKQHIQDIGHAFGYYDYGEERGMASWFRDKEAVVTYICGFVRCWIPMQNPSAISMSTWAWNFTVRVTWGRAARCMTSSATRKRQNKIIRGRAPCGALPLGLQM